MTGLNINWDFPGQQWENRLQKINRGTGSSIQLINPGFDNDLGGNWRSALPAPAAKNSVYADNAAPQIRQVNHNPEQPVSGQIVLITAKVTDPDGIQRCGI